MEKTVRKKPRWRKIGGGSMRLRRGKIVKPNEVFRADPDELPAGCEHLLVALDDIPEEEAPKPTSTKPRFELQSKGGGWYDVVNTVSGKTVNDKSLRATEAKELIDGLS